MKHKRLSKVLAMATAVSMLAASATPCIASDREEATVRFTFYRYAVPTDEAIKDVSDALTALALEKFNTRVELDIVGRSDYAEHINLALAGGEDIDWFQFGNCGMTLPSMYDSDQILPLNDYITEDSALYSYLTDGDLATCSVNGNIVGIPAVKNMALSAAVFFRADVIDELGLKDQVRNATNLDDIEVILAALKEAYPEKYPFCLNVGKINYKFFVDELGDSTYLSGVLENPMEGTTVKDIHETDLYREFCERMHTWYENGWIDPDYETSSNTVNALIQNGESFACFSSNNIDQANASEEDKLANEASQGWTCQLYQAAVSPFFSTSAMVNNHGWAMAYTCKNPERAMEIYEWLFSDPEASTLITEGIEGEHYTLDDNGLAVWSPDSSYERLNWNGPNGFIALCSAAEGNINELVIKANAEAQPSIGKGFVFDSSPIATQIAAITNVNAKYGKGLEGGALDPAEYIPKFVEELKAAGIDEVIAEKQRQFDEWLASQQ